MTKTDKNNKFGSNKLISAGKYLYTALQLVRSHSPRRHSPEHRFRKRFKAGIALGIIIVGFGLTAYHLADERFSRHLKNALHKITGGEVEIGQSEINILSDVRIRDLKVYLPGQPHQQQYLVFSSDDILVEYNPWSIFSRELEVDRIVSVGALINLSFDSDQKEWNITKLKLKKGEGKRKGFPKVIIRDSHIQYRESAEDYLSPPLRQQFSGEVVRDENTNIVSFDFVSDKETALPNCIIDGTFHPDSSELLAELKFDMDKFSAEILPPNLARFKQLYEAIKPRGDLSISSLYSPSKGNSLTVKLQNASAGINWQDTGAILPLNNLSGEIVVTSQETIIKSVKVAYSDATFKLTGSVKGYSKDSDINLQIESTDLDLPKDQWDDFDIMASNIKEIDKLQSYSNDAIASGSFKSVLKMLICAMPPKKKQIIWETLPTGRLNIAASFIRENLENIVSGDLMLVNTSGRHIRFPYRFDGAKGPIHFEPGHVWFGPIKGEKNGQLVTVNGKADRNEDRKWVIDVDVDVKNVIVSDELYQAFNDIQREVFDLFDPTGMADAFYQIHVVQGQQPNDSLDLILKDCSGAFKYFPIPAKHCYGKVRWERDKTTFEIDRGQIAGGSLQASGTVDTKEDSDSVIDCTIKFNDTKLDETVAQQLPSMIKKFYDKASPLGNVSGTAKIRKVFEGHISKTPIDNIKIETVQHDVNLKLSDATVKLEQFPKLISGVDADVRVKDFVLGIKDFIGEIDWPDTTTDVHASGTIDKDSFSVDMDCKQVPFIDEVHDLVKDHMPEIIEKYKPAGIFDLNLSASNSSKSDLGYEVKISPLGMQAEFMDYQLDNLFGQIIASPGKVVLKDFAAANNSIIINGSMTDQSGLKKYDLDIIADKVPVDDNLKNAFSDEVPLLSDDIGLTGVLSCDANLLLETNDPNTDMVWHVNGTGRIDNGSALIPLATTNINSDSDFAIQYDQLNKTVDVTAAAKNAAAKIMDRPIVSTDADIKYNSQDSLLTVGISKAEFCNGKLGGKINSNFTKSDKSTRLELTMKGCDLRDLVVAQEKDEIKGEVSGYINLLHSPENIAGKFEYHISDGALGKLPLIAGILNIVNFSLPHEGAFRDAEIAGDIVGPKTIFTKMDFHGSAVSINGKGEMVGPFAVEEQESGALDITFLIEAPQIIKPIPILGSLFNAVRSGFIHVRATGKYDKPIITPIPLSLIGDIFKDYKSSNKKDLPKPVSM